MLQGNAMIATGLIGPYALEFETIRSVFGQGVAGNFALGYMSSSDVFYINRVGRSDDDIRSALLNLIGSDLMFKYRYAPTSRSAFEGECELFHHFRPPGNFFHPVRPAGTTWQCAYCMQFAR